MRFIRDFDFKNKRVLVRCDFNVPLDKKGSIKEDFKIKQSLKTIKFLLKQGSKIILMSHLADPEGKVVASLRLTKIAKKLENLLNHPVKKAPDCIGYKTEKLALSLKPKEILLLENLRFHKEEKENNFDFAKKIASLGEVYINNAFAESHRSYASIVQLPKLLPGFFGFLLEDEINNLDKIIKNPKKPIVVLMGGAKIKTKVNFIKKMTELADFVLIGSLLEKEIVEKHLKFKHPKKILDPYAELTAKDLDKKTIEEFKKIILKSKTVFWNGPFGKFEEKEYKTGSLEIAKAIIKSKAYSVIGGGETIEFLNQENLLEKFNHVSTGGGAMLAYLSGEKMPGIEALKLKNDRQLK